MALSPVRAPRDAVQVARRTIDPVDTIWLNMDRADNLMVIESLMTTSGRLDRDRLAAVIEERVVSRYPVFRQRPGRAVLPGLLPRWEDDPEFDLARHLHVGELPAPGGDGALQEYIAGQLDRPLPRDRPLWEVHLLQGYGGGSAVYSRLHHSLADGIALTQVLLSLTDASPEGTLVVDDAHPPTTTASSSSAATWSAACSRRGGRSRRRGRRSR